MVMLSKGKIGTLLRAKRREPVETPFYHVTPFLNELRRSLEERLASRGRRTTVRDGRSSQCAFLAGDVAVPRQARRLVQPGRHIRQRERRGGEDYRGGLSFCWVRFDRNSRGLIHLRQSFASRHLEGICKAGLWVL